MTVDSHRLATDPPRTPVVDRGWLGAALALGGAVMLFLGWYGASGTVTVAEQLPYIASGSIPGAALVVAAAVVLSRESNQRSARRAEALIAELHALLVEPEAGEGSATVAPDAAGTDELVAMPGSERYHRASCPLVLGKTSASSVDPTTIEAQHLTPCDVCEPDRPAV